jgi:hypothetical protein
MVSESYGGTEENDNKSQHGYPVFKQIFKPGIFRIRSRGTNHSVVMFDNFMGTTTLIRREGDGKC